MANAKHFEYLLLRYVPHAIREQYVDFGLMLIEMENENGYVGVRFAPNWRGVLHLDPHADVEILEAFEREIRGQLANLRDREVLLHWLEDSHSNLIQVSARRSCKAQNPDEELESLTSIYLDERQIKAGERREGARQLLVSGMQREFERAGIWDLLIHGVSAAEYTRADDTYKFDCGYVLGDQLKLFHGVSLRRSVNTAIEVTSKYKKVVEKRRNETLLTAVVENDLDRDEERISYTLSAMKADGIRIAELREMPGIADAARLELRA